MKKLLFLFVCCLPIITQAQITGSVFRDFNGNGTKESAEPLVAGVLVKAFPASGTQCGTTQTTTAVSAPNYSLSGCTGAVRVEFSIPTTGCQLSNGVDYSGLSGTTYGSSVQFLANGASGTANFALSYPGEYVTNTNPTVFVPRHWNGNPSVAAVGISDGFVGFPYNNVQTSPTPAQKSVLSQLGGLYGVAYSRQAQKVFTSTFLKRHVGLGPLGSGGIYLINPTGATMSVSNFFDMDNPSNPLLATTSAVTAIATNNTTGTPAYGSGTSYNVAGPYGAVTYPAGGLGVIGVNGVGGRNLASTLNTGSNDPAAFDQVGKVSLGDLDISDDGKYLFVTNLYDQKLYRLELDNAQTPTKVIATQSWAMPTVTCTNGVLRPFAIKYHRGTVYVGAVCTGENAGTAADVDAHVFELPSATGSGVFTAAPVLSIPLDFARGTGSGRVETFEVWQNAMHTDFAEHNPQPIFTDIEVDIDGSLIMGFRDRNGDQVGHFNLRLTGVSTVDGRAVGEILRAYKNPTTCSFELESNGKEGASSSKAATAGAGNSQGPGGGEFYYQDNIYNATTNLNATNHMNSMMGALTLIPGTNQVMTTAMDPVQLWSGGVSIFSNTTGQNTADYELYLSNASANDGTFSKVNGLGDVEVMSELAPIEIGNRVWNDADSDGVQDADEAGIAGIVVELKKGTTVIGTATTDTNGNYYFSSATGTSTASVIYGITQLMPSMAYTLHFPTTASGGKSLTTVNSTSGGGTDLIDSDAAVATGDVTVLATDIPVSGANNHTFDVGYSAVTCTQPTFTINAVQPTCASPTGSITIGTITGPDAYTFNYDDMGTYVTGVLGANGTASSGATVASGLSAGTYTVQLFKSTDNTCISSPNQTVTLNAPTGCGGGGQPDLELTKVANKSSVVSGDTFVYTLTLKNIGTASATGVKVKDLIPAGLTYVSSVPSQGTYTSGTGIWDVGTVAQGATLTLTITVTVN